MQRVLEVLKKCEGYFVEKGIAKIDAQLLLAYILRCKRLDLFLQYDRVVSDDELSKFRDYAKRRVKREPLQHILGEVEFFGIKLRSDKRALIPRHETEELCEIISRRFSERALESLRILDLGTGSGAIILSLIKFFVNAIGTGVDKSDDAISLAKENADKNSLSDRVKFFKSDWFESVDGEYDIIVSNPPYLSEDEFDSAEDEVKIYDPKVALTSSSEGYGDIEKILNFGKDYLSQNGKIFIECGIKHPNIIKMNFSDKYSDIEIVKDYNKRDRFVLLS